MAIQVVDNGDDVSFSRTIMCRAMIIVCRYCITCDPRELDEVHLVDLQNNQRRVIAVYEYKSDLVWQFFFYKI